MNDNQQTGSVPQDRSAAAVALDNLVRRKLRVSNPNDPREIANALQSLYTEERAALQQEAAGLPFVRVTEIPARAAAETSTRAELRQAVEDVNRDLTALANNVLLKDVEAELRGWGTAIRQAVADGTNAARFALDPRQRDRAMAARRLLGGYARVARYVGALSPNLSIHYRQLAKSLDEVAGVILVLMGDALANIGYSGGRFLLQAPASELQARRDATIYALRNLVGSAQEAYAPNEWPRGLLAYRQFLKRLEESGQSDLRALFQENYVAQVMDELIHYGTSGTAEDLRALGATAQMALERFQRLVLLSRRLIDPESPPLAAYLSAIQLFLDAFENAASGSRLLFTSRPPIVFYGLYGIGGPDQATERLLRIIIERGQLAQELDCYLGCDCSAFKVRCQVMLDKILYDIDRAIDYYALGTDPDGNGEPEQRAAAYAVIIDQLLRAHELRQEEKQCGEDFEVTCSGESASSCTPRCVTRRCVGEGSRLEKALEALRGFLWYRSDPPLPLLPDSAFDLDLGALETQHQELCTQQSTERQWENLLRTMAPFCFRFEAAASLSSETCGGNEPESGILQPTQDLVCRAIDAIGEKVRDLDPERDEKPTCAVFDVDIPRHYETSLHGLLNNRLGDGGQGETP